MKRHIHTIQIKPLLLLPFFIAFSQPAWATSVKGKLVDGGGVDDAYIVVQPVNGKKFDVYCTNKCGDWFTTHPGEEGFRLKKSLKNKNVVIDYAVEPNKNRIAGPCDDDRLPFVNRVRLVP